ncbi:MAG: hypothetical protein JWM19_4895 [Actinomycetia bacterium]|nr:hypothetical protein [Actinomycetes bacterium]
MRSTQAPGQSAWPTVADAGHVLVPTLHQPALRQDARGGESCDVDLAVWLLFAGLGPLGALPTAPRLARAFSRLVLGSWGLDALQDDTELLMSELTTNAVAAATRPGDQPR